MKNLIYIIIGLVVVVGGGAYLWHEMNEQKEMEEFLNSQNVVEVKAVSPAAASTSSKAVETSGIKTYTMSDVAVHNRKEDCWLVINGAVLDVTGFISMHPGGDKILKGCGVDATGYFNKVSGHMKGVAQSLLNKLKIGEIK